MVVIVLFYVGVGVLMVGTVSAQSTIPSEVQEIIDTDPSEASQEQIEKVQNWFYEKGDSLPSDVNKRVGQWLTEAQTGDSSGGSGGSNGETTESEQESVEETPENVVVEITDGVVVNSYSFDEDSGTVELVLSSEQYTQQLVLTDPRSTEGSGTGTVSQKAVTVPGGETIRTQFNVEYSKYTSSATVWISAGAGQTKYISNASEPLLDTLTWSMIPLAGIASAFAVFTSGLIYVWRKYRSLNNEYKNVFRNI